MSLPRISRIALPGERQQIAAAEDRLSADPRAFTVEEAHEREAGDALPGARLADDPERLAAVQRVGEIGHGPDVSVVRREHDIEVADLENGLAHAYRTRGSRKAYAMSTMRFMSTTATVATMTTPSTVGRS